MKKMTLQRERTWSFFIFISPWMAGFIFLWIIPIIWGFYTSLTNRMAFTVSPRFIGLQHYRDLITDTAILGAFARTILFSVLHTTIAICVGFVMALLLERRVFGRGVFRTLLYFPHMIPLVAVGWIFRIFLERDTGFLNTVLINIGLTSQNIAWLSTYPFFSILTLSFWQAGWSMLIFLGGLSTIPDSLYEAATIDGAKYLRKLRSIVIPMVSPFILFQFLMSVIYSLQVFVQPYILNPRPIRGGALMQITPPTETFFVMARGYFHIMTQYRFAYGLALLWLLFLFIMIVTLIFMKLGAFLVYSEADD